MKITELLLESSITPYELFSKYRGSGKHFVTYTNRPTIQINTTPKFDTPLGLYTYPLDYLLQRGASANTLFNVAPFASNKKHITLVELTSSKVVNLQSYNKYNSDFYKLEEWVLDNYGDDAWSDIENEYSPSGGSGKKIWQLVTTIAEWVEDNKSNKQSITNTMLLQNVLGWEGAIDNGGGIIHKDEPTQAVFFKMSAIKKITTVVNTK